MTNKQIIEGGRLFNKYKIRVHTSNIIGLPHETVASVLKTVELNRQVKPELSQPHILQPYPGTEIHEYVSNKDLLESGYNFYEGHNTFQVEFGNPSIFIPLKLKERKELINLFYLFDILIKHRWLDPLIKILIKIPPNRVFRLIYIFPTLKREMLYSKSLKKAFKSIGRMIKMIMVNKRKIAA